MGADLSRIRSNPLLDFAGVELQQGRVVLDADFNELVAMLDRRFRAATSDVLGRSTVSATTPDAFKITATSGSLEIGKGRLYVDGLLAENHGASSTDPLKQQFDPLLAERQFADPIDYGTQPYLTDPPDLPTSGRHLVYLDVWDREVTPLERPDLIEVALGVDTTSRRQIVWQVRVLEESAGGATCASADEDIDGWQGVIAPSTGRLTTDTVDGPPDEDPCELPPTGGYRGLENQTYRVEIHDPGQPGDGATFKWSRENASVGSRVSSMVSATELELDSLGKDDVLRFNTGDWVEITDDDREFAQQCGEMRQITVNEAAKRLTFAGALPAGMLPAAFPSSDFPRDRNLRVRRWDQKHEVLMVGTGGATPVFEDLDAGTSGVIDVPPSSTTLILENGITVSFDSVGTKGFRAGDYWVFAARTADTSVERLEQAPPRGIHHHYARLGIWDVAAGSVTDCRTPWPPSGGGHDCSCTECVTPESHASGASTIQAAVDRLREKGGTVCLGVGQYQLAEPVRLAGARAVRIRGQGAATVLVTPGTAFDVNASLAVAIEDLAVLSLGQTSAISVQTVLGLNLQRLLVLVLGGNDAKGSAIALSGAVVGAAIRDNAILAPVAVSAAGAGNADEKAPFLLTASVRIDDNVLWSDRTAVQLGGMVVHLLGTRIAGNEVLGCRLGAITALGLCGPGASMRVTDNSINVSGPAITAGVDGLWIEDNKLVAAPTPDGQPPAGAGITLQTGLDPNGADQCQVLSNQISGFGGAGIAIRMPARELIVKLNIIEQCGNGIVSEDAARSAIVSIENNALHQIAGGTEGKVASVVGIGVFRADSATVSGNTLRGIGQAEVRAALCAGVAAAGVMRLRAASNDITDVAPPGDYLGVAAGILVQAPYAQAEVHLNHVARDGQPGSQVSRSQWYGVRIDEPQGERFVARVARFAAVRLDETRTLVFGGRRPYVALAATTTDAAGAVVVRGSAASVVGNTLVARGATPVVELVAAEDCLFNDNRCELQNQTAAAVRLLAGTTIVSANRVRGGETSLQILGNPKSMTVVGNVTTGPIVAGGPLAAPWKDLNVRA